MKNMKIVAESTFHGNVSQTFRIPVECGVYARRCPNACDNKHNKNGIQIHCGCGWPVARVEWKAPEGFTIHAEWNDSLPTTKNNILIFVEPDYSGDKPFEN